ncbi:MAG: hypothetical protein DRO40_07045 [Thermoprotei archaeon]|nr:MAG: hypothetical protein DRO40_07045 [Thermoprotei archaeon]
MTSLIIILNKKISEKIIRSSEDGFQLKAPWLKEVTSKIHDKVFFIVNRYVFDENGIHIKEIETVKQYRPNKLVFIAFEELEKRTLEMLLAHYLAYKEVSSYRKAFRKLLRLPIIQNFQYLIENEFKELPEVKLIQIKNNNQIAYEGNIKKLKNDLIRRYNSFKNTLNQFLKEISTDCKIYVHDDILLCRNYIMDLKDPKPLHKYLLLLLDENYGLLTEDREIHPKLLRYILRKNKEIIEKAIKIESLIGVDHKEDNHLNRAYDFYHDIINIYDKFYSIYSFITENASDYIDNIIEKAVKTRNEIKKREYKAKYRFLLSRLLALANLSLYSLLLIAISWPYIFILNAPHYIVTIEYNIFQLINDISKYLYINIKETSTPDDNRRKLLCYMKTTLHLYPTLVWAYKEAKEKLEKISNLKELLYKNFYVGRTPRSFWNIKLSKYSEVRNLLLISHGIFPSNLCIYMNATESSIDKRGIKERLELLSDMSRTIANNISNILKTTLKELEKLKESLTDTDNECQSQYSEILENIKSIENLFNLIKKVNINSENLKICGERVRDWLLEIIYLTRFS